MINYKKDQILKTIYPYIKGKNVLDVGCTEHELDRRHKTRPWAHDFLRQYARSVKGIDILESAINQLKKEGYDVSCQNAETFSFKEKFDVIFAGELIEHVSNPGLFIGRCAKHLKSEGLLIMTMLNSFNAFRLAEVLYKRTNDPHASKHDEHCAWYSPEVLKQLLLRYNFEIVKIEYTDYPFIRKDPLKYKLVKGLARILDPKKGKFKDTLIVFARLKSH